MIVHSFAGALSSAGWLTKACIYGRAWHGTNTESTYTPYRGLAIEERCFRVMFNTGIATPLTWRQRKQC